MTTAASLDSTPQAVSAGALFKAALVGGAIAAVANMVLYGVSRAAGVDFIATYDPSAGPAPLLPFLPAVSSFVPSIVAALLMLGLGKATKRPATPFIVIAAVFTVLSLGGPMRLDATMGTKVVLSLMHFVAAAAISVPLVRRVR